MVFTIDQPIKMHQKVAEDDFRLLLIYMAIAMKIGIEELVGLKQDLADGMYEDQIHMPSYTYLNDIICHIRGGAISTDQIRAALSDQDTAIDSYVAIDFDAMEENPAKIPIDAILMGMHGAFHGFHALAGVHGLGDSEPKWLSPGQALDIYHTFEFLDLSGIKYGIGIDPKNIEKLHQLFSQAAKHQSPVSIQPF